MQHTLHVKEESSESKNVIQTAIDKYTNKQCRIEYSGLIGRVNKIIETEYNKDIGLDYIGEKVNLSPAYLSFLYKKVTGINLIKYLSNHRMLIAKQLLLNTNLKVAQIARQCGYNYPSYFNRLFKKLCGLTPRQYREQYPA